MWLVRYIFEKIKNLPQVGKYLADAWIAAPHLPPLKISRSTHIISMRRADVQRQLCQVLVAEESELGSAFLCADLGITPEVREDHAAYIGSWLKVLKDDKRLIFSAASQAQRATDYLHSLQPRQVAAKEEGAAA